MIHKCVDYLSNNMVSELFEFLFANLSALHNIIATDYSRSYHKPCYDQ